MRKKHKEHPKHTNNQYKFAEILSNKTIWIFCVSHTMSDFDEIYDINAVFNADSKYDIKFLEKFYFLFIFDFFHVSIIRFG